MSSSDSSTDGASDSFKAAEYFRIHGHLPPSSLAKFKEAQVEALRADPIPIPPTSRKERSPKTKSPTQIQTPRSAAQLLQLLGADTPGRETGEARRLLRAALAQLDAADGTAPAPTTTAITHAVQTLHAASAAQQSAAAAQAEVSLHKLHLEAAQVEIARAQGVVRALEAQRDDAERVAAKARGLARRLQGEKLAVLAREEGRRLGYEAGFGHGRMIAKAKAEERQRQLEAEMRHQQQLQLQQIQQSPIMVVPSSAPRESMHGGGAFIEEETETEPPPPPPPQPLSQAQSRPQNQRRESLESARHSEVPPQPPPAEAHPNPSTRSRPASGASASAARRVSAPPPPRSEVRDSGVELDSVPNGFTPQPLQQREQDRRASIASSRPNSVLNRNSTPTNPPPQQQRQRSGSLASRASTSMSASRNIPIITTTTIPGASRGSYASSSASTQVNARARNAAALTSALMPSQIAPPPPRIHADPSAAFPLPAQHVPMPPPPQQPVSMPVPAPAPAFEVERVGPGPGEREPQPQQQQRNPGRTQTQTPSSVATSLGTLRLTSFPPSAAAAAESATSGSAGAGMGGIGPGMGLGICGGLRERELSVILEHAEGSPGGSVLRNANPSPSPNAWASGSVRYSDPRGMEEWRRETNEEAPRNELPPPIAPGAGLLSPFDIRPVPGGSNASVHAQRSQESLRSATSQSSDTVNITIVPPSRPTSIGLSPATTGYGHGPPTQGPPGSSFLSPDDAPDVPVVPDEEDDDDDDDTDGSSQGTPGMVRALGPLPAFAQGVTYPPGFVPMSVAPPPQPLPPVTQPTWAAPAPVGDGESAEVSGLPLGFQPTTPRAASRQMGIGITPQPPPVDAPPLGFQPATSGFQRETPRPASRQTLEGQPPLTGIPPPLGFQPMTGPSRPPSRLSQQPLGGQSSLGGGPPLNLQSTNVFQRESPRPATRQVLEGQPPLSSVPPLGFQSTSGFQAPAWPASRQMGAPPQPIYEQPPLGFQPPTRPPSRQKGAAPIYAPNASEPIPRPGSRLGNATSAWGAPVSSFSDQPNRPPSRQMGVNPLYASNASDAIPVPPPQTRTPTTSTWTAPPVIGANSIGPSGAAADSSWTLGGGYNFGQTATPTPQPAAPLGFSVEHVSRSLAATHSPQPSRPQSLTGAPAGDTMLRPTTPRRYADPAQAPVSTYFTPTPGRAAGFPLPPSVAASSPATTTTSGQRIASLNAGTTPAAFHTRSLAGGGEYRAPSRASSRTTSRGGSTVSRNQTPNPNANLGITNPYTSIREGDIHSSGSSGSSSSTLGLDQTTAHNTYANANIYATGGPMIPPSPAHSYRPM